MADVPYQSSNLILRSKGVMARFTVDMPPGESYYLQELNLEEVEENSLATRLGTTIVNKIGTTPYPIGSQVAPTVTPTTVTTQGPASPAWTNPSNFIAFGSLYATVVVGSGASPSQQTLVSGITFSLPSNANILGFQVQVYDLESISGTNATFSATLAVSGAAVGVARPVPLATTGAIQTAGGSSDLWGYAGWTVANVNANLGIIFQAACPGAATTISVNQCRITVFYSVAAPVHSLQKLIGLNGSEWRYAGSGNTLWRLVGASTGQYNAIANTLSGQPWGSAVYSPAVSSYPYLYIADLAGMLKDNGTLSAPQQMGIFQPQNPVSAQAQVPDEIILDPFTSGSSLAATSITSIITVTGLQSVTVTNPAAIGLFQSLVIDTGANAETVLVIATSSTGFTANFTKTHAGGAPTSELGVSTTVAASSTGAITGTIATSISTWPTTLSQSDYIGLWMNVSNPSAIQSITLQFNTSNGAYFYRIIGQGPLQATLSATTDSTTAAADAIISDTLGIYTSGAGGVTGLSTVPGWTPILLQLSDFSGAGGADFNDPVMNWQNVTGYTITIVTNSNGSATVEVASLILFGGAGPDSFAGVGYDYLFTFFNANDFAESNPCMVMSNVNPPSQTSWVVPRRQPVLLTFTNNFKNVLDNIPGNFDSQITHIRIYRRGGTLGDNYRRIDQVPWTQGTTSGGQQTYLDIWTDAEIQQADTVSFTNDVPVTSPLPVPVVTTLKVAITGTNTLLPVAPASMVGISSFQQVDIGNVNSPNFETVIVAGIRSTTFYAFVQNTHEVGEPINATANYGQPVSMMTVAFDQAYYGGDPNNPSTIYWSAKGNVQAVSSAAYEPVNYPGDPLTAIVGTSGNLYVSTLQRWWSVAPGSNANASPTIYPTQVDHGCVGQRAWTLRDGVVYYLALDGLRTFRGGGGDYISEVIEWVWQNTGSTPIPIADPTQFSTVQVSWWNRWVFFSYMSLDGNRWRVVLDVDNKRYRTDGIDAESMFLEEDTGTLVWGDKAGLVHLDRQLVAYDERNSGGVITQGPIALTLQTPFSDQGSPAAQKNYNEFTLDANTNGNPVTVELSFNDGEFTETVGIVNTIERQKVNLSLNGGEGFQAYKVSMLLTGAGTERIYLYQAKIRHLLLGETRLSYDSYDLRLGTDESKILKQIYVETTATAPITCNVYYDGNTLPGFTFTIPEFGGVRNSLRVRLPAVSFRIIRFVFQSTSDFILWETSKFEYKVLCQGKGWSTALLMP